MKIENSVCVSCRHYRLAETFQYTEFDRLATCQGGHYCMRPPVPLLLHTWFDADATDVAHSVFPAVTQCSGHEGS